MADTPTKVGLQLTGRETEEELPAILMGATRAADGRDDGFLPAGYLQRVRSFDVGPTARSSVGGTSQQSHEAAPDEIIVLELADGSTLITSAERLRETLRRTHPEMLDGDTILLEKLRNEGAAAGRGLGEAVGGLISKVFTLAVGAAPDLIIEAALDKLQDKAELGVSWLGTKVLMEAIESRLAHQPGLYHWIGTSGTEADLQPAMLVGVDDMPLVDPQNRKMLVFVHGTGSSTLGSFGELRTGDRDLWGMLEARYPGGIFGFEHRTLSESPIENAIQLVKALPRGAHVSLASHSRGGLVADLLCLGNFDPLIDSYCYGFPRTGDADADESARVLAELEAAHAEQRKQLRRLARLLRERRIVVDRYVRTAGPANGTLLASGNFDVFLSGMLTLIGAVPFFFGNPLYSAFKRVVVEVAKNRTNPHLVPGIEAMLPDSPMARLMRDAPLRGEISMAVIAGDIEGGNLLKRLGVLLTDFLLFDKEDNDLVVNTPSMLAGIAPKAKSRVLFDRGADVSHFRYFSNIDTRSALRDWLVSPEPDQLPAFRELPSGDEYDAALASAERSRAVGGDDKRPIVVVLPGVMGSHLLANRHDRVWFDPLDIATGGLEKIAWGRPGVEADELFAMSYGKVCEYLSSSHRVERFPYDWRQPIDVLAERLGEYLDQLMKKTDAPIRLLAHSMGGLVVRACIYKRRTVMDALMARDGARLVMCGTPNQGAHSMVANLIGKGDTLRTLVRLDLKHDMQGVLDIVANFRGALQLLPKPGFIDTFQGQPDGGGFYDYQDARSWTALRAKVSDFWFGDKKAGTPGQQVLDAGSWLWQQDGAARPQLPAAYERNSIYVFGVARNTPCGLHEQSDGKGGWRVKLVGTTRGDGTVTWDSGRIGGIGRYYYQPAQHGDLLSTPEHFPALTELLTSGETSLLGMQPPATRAIEQPQPVVYDAGPPTADDPDAMQRSLLGGSLRNRVAARPRRRLEVVVKAMDLRFLKSPILVGHYEQDPISGAESLVDRELLAGDLTERHTLGLYAGPRGTATVVLRIPNEFERERGSLTGAIVTGLGRYEGSLSPSELTGAVRAGTLRYLLQIIDVLGKADREVPLATLLIGFNSSANLTVGASVEAIINGVMEANARFFETTRLNIRISRLDIIELYVDTAITAVYALRQLTERLASQAERHGATLVPRGELVRGEGARQRLFDDRNSSYWPRLLITDADRNEEDCPPESPHGATGPAPRNGPRSDVTLVADRLRFLYVGQRARAESVVQQRQPGLIEALVAQQIRDPRWNEDFGRMLFQLMVPHDFKDAARQLDRVVLVVDSQTANLPWELMLADDPSRRSDPSRGPEDSRPLSLRAAVVRQLSASRYRQQVRQAIARTALVIGNPSVKGFGPAFPTTSVVTSAAGGSASMVVATADDPPPLPGAEAEAVATAGILASMGYAVKSVIGAEQSASTVFAMLYQQPWRVLHISAHGVFNLRHVDGRQRSGVLLSDGLLITAAEVGAMELVPDLVFLNCCHLGQIDGGRNGNKLAASVASELIQIGVRCVIVAGWAVDDRSAKLFGQVFYEELLLRRQSFGDAVFHARLRTWENNPTDITWGAFQAYGDPGWVAEPRAVEAHSGGRRPLYVSPDELLDDLARARAELSRRRGMMSERETRARADEVTAMVKQRCPPGWSGLPQLHSALGVTWLELNQLDKARESFLAAIRAEDAQGVVPIRDIERLANVEARLGERLAEEEIASAVALGRVSVDHAEGLIDLALKRLDGLDALVSASADPTQAASASAEVNSLRSALRGSAWKRKASLQARRLLSGRLSHAEADEARAAMNNHLQQSIEAYRSAEGSPGSSRFFPYLALNRLALDSLTSWSSPASKDAAIALAQQCRQNAEQGFADDRGPWGAVIPPESLLVEHLIKGSLGRNDDTGRLVFDSIVKAYADATSNISVKPSEVDSIVSHLDLISRFCDALSLGPAGDPAMATTADRLIDLARRVQPGRPPRSDRPPGAAAPEHAAYRDKPAATATGSAKPGPRRRKTSAGAAQQGTKAAASKAPAKPRSRKPAAKRNK
ncbi:CHAT domain-containing protein [Piscinibacter sakaiensis]|uniref:CHAT domain-containing protein n=1 Tax=Piscinibacter sakaiensis TaxID=1547922 RepID=UPI003AAE123E